MEAWWAAVREPVEPIGVTELLEALWWLPGPEQAPEDGLVKAMSADPIDVDRLDSAGWVELGLSPRGLITWQRVAQGWAFLQGRDFVIPDDIQAVALPVLKLRISGDSDNTDAMIREIIESVPVPDDRS